MEKNSITIIDDENLRGVVGPAKTIPKKLLEDMIDLIELSSDAMARGTEKRIAEADRKKSWVPLNQARKVARMAK